MVYRKYDENFGINSNRRVHSVDEGYSVVYPDGYSVDDTFRIDLQEHLFSLLERGMSDAGLIGCSCSECPDDEFPSCYDVGNMDEILHQYYLDTGETSFDLIQQRIGLEQDIVGSHYYLFLRFGNPYRIRVVE